MLVVSLYYVHNFSMPLHSYVQQMFTEHLLYVSYCSRLLGYINEQSRERSLLFLYLHSSGEGRLWTVSK